MPDKGSMEERGTRFAQLSQDLPLILFIRAPKKNETYRALFHVPD